MEEKKLKEIWNYLTSEETSPPMLRSIKHRLDVSLHLLECYYRMLEIYQKNERVKRKEELHEYADEVEKTIIHLAKQEMIPLKKIQKEIT
jgi:hypothetical protein